MTIYADGHQLCTTGKTHEATNSDLMSQMQGWQALAYYNYDGFLLENPKKFQSLCINPRNIDATNFDRALDIDSQEIIKTERVELQCVSIDENLKFAGLISDLCTRTSQN